MRTNLCLSVAASLLLLGCGQDAGQPGQPTNGAASSGNPLDAPADYLGALSKAQQTAVKTTDVASLNRAIQMFTADEGRNPKDLNELVEKKYLPKLPAAPNGMKLDYDAETGKAKVVAQ